MPFLNFLIKKLKKMVQEEIIKLLKNEKELSLKEIYERLKPKFNERAIRRGLSQLVRYGEIKKKDNNINGKKYGDVIFFIYEDKEEIGEVRKH